MSKLSDATVEEDSSSETSFPEGQVVTWQDQGLYQFGIVMKATKENLIVRVCEHSDESEDMVETNEILVGESTAFTAVKNLIQEPSVVEGIEEPVAELSDLLEIEEKSETDIDASIARILELLESSSEEEVTLAELEILETEEDTEEENPEIAEEAKVNSDYEELIKILGEAKVIDLLMKDQAEREELEIVSDNGDGTLLFQAGNTEQFAPNPETPVADGAPANQTFEWEGPLVVEGIETGDKRIINEGALTWRNLPLPLMMNKETSQGHMGAIFAGSIDRIERRGSEIWGFGNFDNSPEGREARRLINDGVMRGVSVDLDDVEVQTPAGQDPIDSMLGMGVVMIASGRIAGVTMVTIPAFQEAYIQPSSNTLETEENEELLNS